MISASEILAGAVFRVLLVGLAVSFFATPLYAKRKSPLEVKVAQVFPKAIKSSSGRFMVVGTNSVENVYIARWAEGMTDKLSKMLSVGMPFKNRLIRINIKSTPGANGKKEGEPWVSISQGILNKRFEQRLIIYNYDNERRDYALTLLLLNGYVRKWDFEKWPLAGLGADPTSYSMYQVPRWFSYGITGNLSPDIKAKNSADVVHRWSSGKLPSLSQVIVSDRHYDSSGREPDKAMCGVFVSWLLSMPKNRIFLGKMFTMINAGDAVTLEWLSEVIPGCGSREQMEENWDWWLKSEKRRVYKPGTTSLAIIKDLQSELLIYPAEFAISTKVDLPRAITLHDLISLRKEAWVKKAAKSKSISLSLLAAGRGKDFCAVVDLYREFLNSLAGKGKTKDLYTSLAIAESARKNLLKKYSKRSVEKK